MCGDGMAVDEYKFAEGGRVVLWPTNRRAGIVGRAAVVDVVVGDVVVVVVVVVAVPP